MRPGIKKNWKQLVLHSDVPETAPLEEQLIGLAENEDLSQRRPNWLVWSVKKPRIDDNYFSEMFGVVVQDFYIPEDENGIPQPEAGYYRWLGQSRRVGGLNPSELESPLVQGDMGFYFGKITKTTHIPRGKQLFLYFKHFQFEGQDIRIPFIL